MLMTYPKPHILMYSNLTNKETHIPRIQSREIEVEYMWLNQQFIHAFTFCVSSDGDTTPRPSI